MKKRGLTMRGAGGFVVLAMAVCLPLALSGRKANTNDHDWAVGGGRGSMHYSSLRQINTNNVGQLKLAWRFDSHDEFDGSEEECNPLVVNGVVYATTPRLRVVALDGKSGRMIWSFDSRPGETVRTKQRNRGLTYWTDGRQARLFVGIGPWLYSIDAETGKPDKGFGADGRLDLRLGLDRDGEPLTVGATSPGVIYKDLLILGSIVAEDLPAALGDIRAFDVRTGKIRWTFHTVPRPGEYGYQTWPADAWKHTGGANSWMGLTLDEKRGVVYAPTGSAAFDFYGADRLGDDLFADSVLALEAETGKRVWHFQAVKHDLWDRDFPAAPTLVKVRRSGRTTDALAQITKSGFVWILDRDTGKPLTGVRTVEGSASEIEGESAAKTQILPLSPAPFARQQLTEEILTDRTPAAHEAALAWFKKIRSGPQFTPLAAQGTSIFPGLDGGGEWGGAAWDPQTGLLYVNSNEMAWILSLGPRSVAKGTSETGKSMYMQNCSGCHRPDRKGTPPEFPSLIDVETRLGKDDVFKMVKNGGGRMPGFARLGDERVAAIVHYVMTGEDMSVHGAERERTPGPTVKYGISGYNKFLDPDGFPAIKPPWGTLNAIDLNTGEYRWKIPFGEYPALVSQGLHNTGSENYGGPVVTAGGLLFIGATDFDHKLHAYDKVSGKLLWETILPAGGNATPAVYESGGREFLVIAAGGGKSGQVSGGSYVAYSLP